MTTILLARHGQASFGQENYDQLSKLGRLQARMLGEHYASAQRRIDAVFSGALVRQRDSARHFWDAYQPSVSVTTAITSTIFNDTEHHILPLFDEFNHEDVFVQASPNFKSQAVIAAELKRSNKPLARLGQLFHIAMQRWHAEEHDSDYIESWSQFSNRTQQALDELCQHIDQSDILDDNSTILVFTSGGVIAALTSHLLGQASQTAYQLTKSSVNTGVTTISVQHDMRQLLSYNEHSHLFAKGERFMTPH